MQRSNLFHDLPDQSRDAIPGYATSREGYKYNV